VGAVSRREACQVAADFFDPGTGILAAVGDATLIRPVLESFADTTLWDADGPRA
jgi:hypothetical protein